MPFDGNGNFVRVRDWTTDESNSVPMLASNFDQEDDGFAAALSNCITRDGQSLPTQNLPMNGRVHTGMGTPTANDHSANKGYVDAAAAAAGANKAPLVHQHAATDITSGALANAQISQASVAQHQAALTIGWGQLSGVPGSFAPAAHNHDASALTSGTVPDGRISQSSVGQHQTALSTRNISGKSGILKTLSTSAPSGGSDGDIWYVY